MNPEPIGISLVLKHFEDKYLSPLEADLGDNTKPQGVEREDFGPGNNLSGAGKVLLPAGKIDDTMPFADERLDGRREFTENPSGVNKSRPAQFTSICHEIVIETTRFGDGGEPLTLRLLCCIKSNPEIGGWTALPDAEVVETRGDFHEGELVHLTLEEMEKAVVEGEADYLNDD